MYKNMEIVLINGDRLIVADEIMVDQPDHEGNELWVAMLSPDEAMAQWLLGVQSVGYFKHESKVIASTSILSLELKD
jgi:hypothetical protein